MKNLIIDLKLDNWNDIINHNRTNKYSGANKKKKEMQNIKYFLMNIKPIEDYPVEIICKWHIKNVNSDLDNKSLKSVLDAMQEMKILKNDNCKCIQKITYIAIKDTKDYLELEICSLQSK